MKKVLSGFSLVEVTIALGIIAFCVVSVFGLLPVALRSTKDATDRRAAVEIMNKLAGDVLNLSSFQSAYRSQTNTAQSNFSLSGEYNDISLSSAGKVLFYENAEGERVPQTEARYAGLIEITPAANGYNAGVAKISVAWPAVATTNNSPSGWTNAQGSVRTIVYFNP